MVLPTHDIERAGMKGLRRSYSGCWETYCCMPTPHHPSSRWSWPARCPLMKLTGPFSMDWAMQVRPQVIALADGSKKRFVPAFVLGQEANDLLMLNKQGKKAG